jgi:hypothetical protein
LSVCRCRCLGHRVGCRSSFARVRTDVDRRSRAHVSVPLLSTPYISTSTSTSSKKDPCYCWKWQYYRSRFFLTLSRQVHVGRKKRAVARSR